MPAPTEPWMPPHSSPTPNAEKYLLEADALRRRQLVSALLHGSRRTWREQRRIWPGVVAGVIVVAVIVAVFGVLQAVHSTSSDSAPARTHGAPARFGR
jgi:hypothetical protein